MYKTYAKNRYAMEHDLFVVGDSDRSIIIIIRDTSSEPHLQY